MTEGENKVRVTFRIHPELAAALREQPNQTLFVETALAEALGERCPTCGGRGKIQPTRLRVTDLRAAAVPRLAASTALRLREIVRLGRRLLATELHLAPSGRRTIDYALRRDDELLLRGTIARSPARRQRWRR